MIQDSRVAAREHFAMRRTISENLSLLESKIQDDVAIFRTDIIDSFKRHGALIGTQPWMLFRVDAAERDNDPIEASMDKREILITMATVSNPRDIEAPLIRIFTNQSVFKRGQPAIISEDVIVDQFGDAQYLMDAISDSSDTKSHSHSNKTYAVMFSPAEDTRMGYANKCPYTPILDIIANVNGINRMVLPYGQPSDFEHRNYALAKARGLLAETAGYVPEATGNDG